MPDIVCIGEVMVELNAVNHGPLRSVDLFEKHAAGAEGNVAIGASRLGCSSGMITRVGDDEFGLFFMATLKGENVDTSHISVDKDFPTATFLATQLKGWMLQDSLRAALATAALVVGVRGDYENIPTIDALRSFLEFQKGKAEYLR